MNTAATPAGITAHEWAWVRALIQDVMREREREDFVTAYAEWNLAIRQFRKIEDERIILNEPTAEDLLEHEACLAGLVEQGRNLVRQATKLTDAEMAALHIARENLEAGLWSLQHDWDVRHHQFSEAELEAARLKIFGATP